MSPTATLSQPWSESLIEALERQHACVSELTRLAQTQAPMISAAQTDRLLDVLARRQQLIDEFSVSQREVSELTKRLDQRLDQVEPDERERIKSLITRIGEGLARIMRCEEQDETSLRAAKHQVKRELSELDAGRAARHAYVGGSAGPEARNRFADRSG